MEPVIRPTAQPRKPSRSRFAPLPSREVYYAFPFGVHHSLSIFSSSSSQSISSLSSSQSISSSSPSMSSLSLSPSIISSSVRELVECLSVRSQVVSRSRGGGKALAEVLVFRAARTTPARGRSSVVAAAEGAGRRARLWDSPASERGRSPRRCP